MSNYDDDQFADADDEDSIYMNPTMFRRNVIPPMGSAAAMGIYAGGPAYASSFGRAQAVAAAAAAQVARRQQAVAHRANAWGDIQAAAAAGQSMGGNGSTWNALNRPTSLSSQLNDVGLISEATSTVPNPLTASTATAAAGVNNLGYPPFYLEQQRQQQAQLSQGNDDDGNDGGNDNGGSYGISNNAQETQIEQSIPPVQNGLSKSAQPKAKRKSSGPTKTTKSKGDTSAEVVLDRVVAGKKRKTAAKKITPIEINSPSSSPHITSQQQAEKEGEEEVSLVSASEKPASISSIPQRQISVMKPAPHKRQNRCFMIPDSLERQQVLLATKLVSEEITQGTWMGNKSKTRLEQAALALEQFAIEIILPSLEARATNVKYGAASNERPLFATLLALREVLMLNTAAIFGEDALDIFEDAVDEVKLEGKKQQHDTKKESEKPGTENNEKKPHILSSSTSTDNHSNEDGTKTEKDSKPISDNIIKASAVLPPSANGNATDNTSKTESAEKKPSMPATSLSSPTVVSSTVNCVPEEAKGVDRPQTTEEKVFRANLLATGIIFAAIDRLGPPRSEIIANEMGTLVEKYDSGHEEFATCLEAADGRVRGVCPNGTPLDKEENVTWRVNFNSVRKKHPLFVKQKKRHALEKADALAAMVPVNEEGLAHRVTMASPNACHISMVEVAPNDL